MKQVLIRRGQVLVENIPAPLIEPGHVLVEVAYSLISTGTELSNIETSGKPLIKRAFEQPERVKQVMTSLRSQGIQKTVAKIQGQLDAGSPAGYSCSGIVIQVGEGVSGIVAGDLVACAGSGWANHAEVVIVPANLVTKVPDGCDLRSAASVTLGAVALQGVRRADPRLGEIVAVIGLGLLGQITVQLLAAQGCRVIGVDLDVRRVELAHKLGAEHALVSGQVDLETEVQHLTGGHGVDATILTAASSSDALVQQAMEITRRKGRVVVVGAVGLGLERSPFYEKEIDFLISCSYGPGRYDGTYEEKGVDYPYAYVRWTENRNMAEYLRLIAIGKIQLESILDREYDISQAEQAYESLRTDADKPLGILLRYLPGDPQAEAAKFATKVTRPPRSDGGRINIALIGAGNFAKSMHLPNLQQLSSLYHIRAIVSATGSNAQATARQFGADYASTDFQDVLTDPEVNAVLISTRHHLHAGQVVAALRAGKHVYCEKPLALSEHELDSILDCYHLSLAALENQRVENTAFQPILMVGYNRRFSPAAKRVRQILAGRQNPAMVLYRVNAGYIPPDSWIQGAEGGGRIIGEMCHMFDLFNYWIGSPAKSIGSEVLVPHTDHVLRSDNISATISYADGSVCSLFYSALGASELSKEYIEVYVDGKTLVVDDFKNLRILGAQSGQLNSLIPDKGHKEALEQFARAINDGSDWPISLSALVEASRLSLVASRLQD